MASRLRLAAAPTLAVASATGVDASIVLAGPGARAMAFMIDWLLRSLLAVFYMLLASLLLLGNLSFAVEPDEQTTWYLAGVMPTVAIYFLYHLVLEPLMSGRTPGKRMAGVRVVTLEGLGDAQKPHPLQRAFLEENAGQCGYCVAGILISAKALLDRVPRPSSAQIRDGLRGHLCRCGSQPRFLRAIARAAQAMQAGGAGESDD